MRASGIKKVTISMAGWKAAFRLGLKNSDDRTAMEYLLVAAYDAMCEECSRRESDKKRDKCRNEREKPVCEQHGAA